MNFFHYGIPIAKKRHRMANGIAYDPQSKEKRNLKWVFASQFRQQQRLKQLEGPIGASVDIGVPIPLSWSKKRREAALWRFAPTRPDLDNYEKMYFDVLNQIAYKDDSQISSIFSQKRYTNKPGIEINLIPLEDNMINEHAVTFKGKLSLEDLNYIVKKANRLGLMNRSLTNVFQTDDKEGSHLYFVVEPMKSKTEGI